MNAASTRKLLLSARAGAVGTPSSFSSSHGRSPPYRRVAAWQSFSQRSRTQYTQRSHSSTITLLPPRSPLLTYPHISALPPSYVLRKSLHTTSRLKQENPPRVNSNSSSQSRSAESTSDSSKNANDDAQKNTGTEEDQAKGREQQEQQQGEKKGDDSPPPPPPPPHGDKSPWQVFTDTLRTEFKASKEWNESTKALASSAQEFTQNETLKRARSAYGAASDAATTTTAKAIKTTGKVIGQGAGWAWDTAPVKVLRASASATGRGLEKVTRPVRETETFKSMKDVIDDGSSSRYGGWTDKDERKRLRESRELKEAIKSGRPLRKPENTEEDPEAGTNITVHKDAAWKESWKTFRDSNRLMQSLFSLKSTYNESENPLISTARSISDRVAGFFAENETATVIKKFREMDPSFQLEPFLQDMREYILPEVLDAYVKADVEVLKQWLSAAQFQVYSALMHQYTTAGLKSDGRILDIRNVDVLSARLLEPGEIPVFIITCRTQEVHVYRNVKTNELAAGMEDRVQQVTYAIGVTRIPEDVSNPETRGWRLIELQKSARDYT